MGLSNMLEANPGVDTFLPKGGTVLNIPQQLILPDTVHEGIIINSAEMRLYYYPKGTNTVIVLPIGIGQLGKDTPINWTTKVERKKPVRPGRLRQKCTLNIAPPASRCLPSYLRARITRWACTRCTSVACMLFTAPTPTSASGFA
ncbi:L,D-transpeptidase [Salmonella enterica subsp. enterica serovar Enteritidis str. 22558]|nr:L,D-transpeptidase [Salmonella enterica subsp. enterica serovar Enteritidis str. 22558]